MKTMNNLWSLIQMTKKTKSLNQDQLYDMMWANDWQIVEQTQKLLELLKEGSEVKSLKLILKNVDEIQDLIDKKYNIIGAQMILDGVEK